ncbi:MAG: cation:proton antiporter [Chthonomonadetes bacterium]|nr:cation:proton antiporter [Chthonomonadetes bacterium]
MEFMHILLMLTIILAAAKLLSELSERISQPAVLGELLAGLILGDSLLRIVDPHNEILHTLAELGAVLLLFEIGLESDITELFRVGWRSLWVAIIGVVTPAVLGFAVSLLLGLPVMPAIFIGATLTATSVGITARVLKDIGILRWGESQIILGAAVADDVIGLLILAVVSGLVQGESLTVWQVGKVLALALVFLLGALTVGLKASHILLRIAEQMRARAALVTAALVFCFLFAALAQVVGLAPIVGAFSAGLVLARTEHRIRITERASAIADMLVPLFFVVMGAQMNLRAIDITTPAGRSIIGLAALLIVVAIVGKMASGLAVWRSRLRPWLIGVGMVPRGEVGLIFATIGLQQKVFDVTVYTAVLVLVMVTTLITPPWLRTLARRYGARAQHPVPEHA